MPADPLSTNQDREIVTAEPEFVTAERGFVPAIAGFAGTNRRFVATNPEFVSANRSFVPTNRGFAGTNPEFAGTKLGFVPAKEGFVRPVFAILRGNPDFLPNFGNFHNPQPGFLLDLRFEEKARFLRRCTGHFHPAGPGPAMLRGESGSIPGTAGRGTGGCAAAGAGECLAARRTSA